MAILRAGSKVNTGTGARSFVLGFDGSDEFILSWSAPAAARTLTIPDPGGNDTFVFLNASQTLINKTISAAQNTITGLGAANVTANLITGQPEETLAADSDFVLIYDASAAALRKMTRANFLAGSASASFVTIDCPSGTAPVADSSSDTLTLVADPGLTITGNAATDTITFTPAVTGLANPSALIGLTPVNGTATTAMRSDAAPALDQSIAPTWTGLHKFNRGTTPADAIQLDIDPLTAPGQRDSHYFVITGRSYDTSAHTINWRQFVDVTSDSGASTFRIQSRKDAGSFTDRLTISDDGSVIIPGNLTVNGTTTTVNTQTLDVADKNITVNVGGGDASAEGAGLTVARTGTAGSFIYRSTSATRFAIGDAGSEVDVVGTSSTQTLTNKTLGSGCALGADFSLAGYALTNAGSITGKDLTAATWQLSKVANATASAQGASQDLKFQGSGWNGTAAQERTMTIRFKPTSASEYALYILDNNGNPVVRILQNGDIETVGTIREVTSISLPD